MVIDFANIEEQRIDGFKGGEGLMLSRAFQDGRNRIMLNTLKPGASAGFHAHSDNCEMIYVLGGALDVACDGGHERVEAGMLHYCPKGQGHSFCNVGEGDAVFLGIVPEQK